MKAFDDWWEYESFELSDCARRSDCKLAWKAALEWALKSFDKYVQEWDIEILDDIKKELNNEK